MHIINNICLNRMATVYLAILTGPLNAATSAAVVTARTVAMANNGDTGSAGDPAFTQLETYALGANGAVTLYGQGTESGIGSGSYGIWREESGATQLVIENGDSLPSLAGAVVSINPFDWMASSDGTIYASVNLTGTGINGENNTAILHANSGGISVVAQKGDFLPGTTSSETFSQFVVSGIAGYNQLIFTGSDNNNNHSIWSYESGVLTSIYRYGDPVPTAMSGLNISPWYTKVNGYGDVAFRASLWDSGGNYADTALFSIVDDELNTIATNGQHAPGTEQDVAFAYIDMIFAFGTTITPIINDRGNTAFYADLTGPGVSSVNNAGIWLEREGQLSLVVREGDAAPQVGPGASFNEITETQTKILINGLDAIAFNASVRDPNAPFPLSFATRNSIWTDDGDNRLLIVKQGDEVPGMEAGPAFGYGLEPLEYTDSGQLLFRAAIGASSPTKSLWVANRLGSLSLIAMEGELFDVDDDEVIEDLRTIETIDARPQMNQAGQVAVKLDFTDGSSGLFVIHTILPGDLNGDGFVGIADLNAVLSNWNENVTHGDPLLGDANGDGFVGIEDLNAVLGNWNTGTPPGGQADIPEPAAVVVILLALPGVCARRCRL